MIRTQARQQRGPISLSPYVCMKKRSHSEICEKISNKPLLPSFCRIFGDTGTYTGVIILRLQILFQVPKIWPTNSKLSLFSSHLWRFTVKLVVKAEKGAFISRILLLYQFYLSKTVFFKIHSQSTKLQAMS